MNRVFFGHHKCASRFFRIRIFAAIAKVQGWKVVTYHVDKPPYHFSSLPDLDLDMVDFTKLSGPEPVVVNLLNSSPAVLDKVAETNPNFRGLHVVRDPRQVLISAYFHHRGTHPISGSGFVWDKLAIDRPILRALSEEDGILYEMNNITRDVINHMMAWPGDTRVLEARVEDINQDRPAFLRRLAQHLDLAFDTVPEIDWTQNFSDSGGGHWKEHFTPRIKEDFKRLHGDALIKLGYERNHDW
ncbi:hypothetical protein [Pseudorhodoplanes sp.]|jgi:hypothetical protein|uniref:hypothetical protein n=1 Tax=Pseudorhodoplanes sp. TaxID=1934341 RepID=UPI002C5C1FCB|nr:hypothetical protein [Pseudorhodoplanes sp.]HWV41591.1 hypothetical protein [Pseudorhodoplanes sp.]